MRKKALSWLLAVSMVLSLFAAAPMTAAGVILPEAVFSDGDLDRVYFMGDTLSFNLSGLPVGLIPAGTELRVSLGIVDASNTFSDFGLFETLSNGTGDGTGFYETRTLQADGTLSSDISGTITDTVTPTTGLVAVRLYYNNGGSWQNAIGTSSPNYIPLSEGTDYATVGLDSVLVMPDGVTSDPVIGTSDQDNENLRNMEISFSKTIAAGVTGTIAFTGLNLLEGSAELTDLEDGLVMDQVSVPVPGTLAQYTLGVDVDALSFLDGVGAAVSATSVSFDGCETSDFEAAAAGVTGGIVSSLAFDDATDTVSFAINHFSSYTLSVIDPGSVIIFYDDFESDSENTYPPTFTIQYDGTGSANQKIISTEAHDGLTGKIFQLEGAAGWSSEQYIPLPGTLPENIVIDAYIKPVTTSRNAELALRNLSVGSWGTRISSVWFEGDGTIVAVRGGNDDDRIVIGTYTVGKWYRVTLDSDMTAKTYNVYLNGVLAASDIPMNPSCAPTTLSLIAHNITTSTAYFDNVGIYTQLPDFSTAYDGEFDIENAAGFGSGFSFSDPTLTITDSGDYLIYGTGTQVSRNIAVSSGVTANLTLDDVNASTLSLGGTAGVTLVLEDGSTNTFHGSTYSAAVRVTSGAVFTVEGDTAGTGQLIASGGNGGSSGYGAAGIGGNHNEGAGTIIINGGTVTASGGSDYSGAGAGIGGGGTSGTTLAGGTIAIHGGNVTAYGGTRGAGSLSAPGIGGYGATQLTIDGGTVTAYGGDYGIYSRTLTDELGEVVYTSALAFGADASVQAFSGVAGVPAISGTTAASGHSAHLLSFSLDAAVSGDTDITITRKESAAETFELTVPNGYRNFAATVETSDDYTAALTDGSKKVAATSDDGTDFPGVCDAPETALSYYSVKLMAEPPYATGVRITGAAKVGRSLSGEYTFNNADADSEFATGFRWLRTGTESTCYNGFNAGEVSNGPTAPAEFTLTEPTFISKIWTYHWNLSSGASPGTLSLRDQDNNVYGPWQATGLANNTHWQATPNVLLQPGIYTVIDSDESTWSYNGGSGGAGFIWVYSQAFEPISGATSSTYTLALEDRDQMIGFEVTVRDAQGHTGSPVSVFVGPVVKVPFWSDGITAADQYPYGGGDGASEEQAFEIATAEQLAQLAYNVNSGISYSGQYFVMTAEINLAGKQWIPIGKTYGTSFDGSFNGGGYSVSGLTLTEISGAEAYGLFGNLNVNGTIEDVTVESGTISFSETAGYGYFGGIVGHSLGLVKNCVNKADVTVVNSEWTYAGGIVGFGDADTWSYTWSARISGCRNEGDIQIGRLGSVGGIIGSQMNGTAATYIDQCSNGGSVTGGQNAEAGGIAGRIDNSGTIGIINCFNTGSVTSGTPDTNSAYAGGIIGYQYYSQVKNCYNTGSITLVYGSIGNTFVGGISGYSDGNTRNCYNTGTVTGTGRAGEGITGSGSSCENCYYLNTCTPGAAIGGTMSLTGDQMKGLADSTIVFSYAGSGLSYGPATGAFLYALDLGRYSSAAYPDGFLNWSGDEENTNGGYPVFSGADYSYVVSFETNGGSAVAARAVPEGGGISEAPAATKDGSTFGGWFTSASGGSKVTFPFTPSAHTILYAQWATQSTGGGGGSSSAPGFTVTTETAGSSTTNRTEVKPVNSSGASSVSLPSGLMAALLYKAQETGGTGRRDILQIAVDTPDGAAGLRATLPQSSLADIASDTDASLAVTSSFLSVCFDGKVLETISGAFTGGSVVIGAAILDSGALSESDRKTAQGRPVYDFSVTSGGKQVSDFGGGHATVTIPYSLGRGENPNCVVIYYLADDGTLQTVRGRYDAGAKAVVFRTPHFSKFVIGYNEAAFGDVADNAWYRSAVEFIAARGVTTGVGNDLFAPEGTLTRGQFIVMLLRAYGIAPEDSSADNFTDAGNTYYTGYLGAAKKLGISSGVGNNLFAPEQAITRQEMFVMLYNALAVMGEVPDPVSGKQLSDFSDAPRSASWAREALDALISGGSVSGSGGKIGPAETATRAQMAQVLFNLLSK